MNKKTRIGLILGLVALMLVPAGTSWAPPKTPLKKPPWAGRPGPPPHVTLPEHVTLPPHLQNGEPPSTTGTITIVKVAEGTEGETFDFTLTDPSQPLADPIAEFTLPDGGSRTDELPQGIYGYAESGLPEGWVLAYVDCDSGDWQRGLFTDVIVELQAGDDITCTFYNVREDPEDLSGFDADLAEPGPKTVGTPFDINITNATDTTGTLVGGDRNVTVDSDIDGRVHDGAVLFSDGIATVPVSATTIGEHTLDVAVDGIATNDTVSFVSIGVRNIVIVKDAPGAGEDELFEFELFAEDELAEPFLIDEFSLSDGGSHTHQGPGPGRFLVTERVPEGWALDRIECDSDEGQESSDNDLIIELADTDDDHITCTFYNVVEPTDDETLCLLGPATRLRMADPTQPIHVAGTDVVLKDVRLSNFQPCIPPAEGFEVVDFTAYLAASISYDGGDTFSPYTTSMGFSGGTFPFVFEDIPPEGSVHDQGSVGGETQTDGDTDVSMGGMTTMVAGTTTEGTYVGVIATLFVQVKPVGETAYRNTTPSQVKLISPGADGTLCDPELEGDVNGDGVADDTDFALLQQSYGSTDPADPADLNGDGVVDAADYLVWRNNAGKRCP